MDKPSDHSLTSFHRHWLPYGLILIGYILVTFLTDAYFMGDTWIYVADILKAPTVGANFWDFGHALWRPFGWLVARFLYSLRGLGVVNDQWSAVTLALLGINWVSGLIGGFLIHALASKFCKQQWVVYLITATFLLSNAILNYAQTAQPYVPGIALLFAGLYLLVRDGEKNLRSKRTEFLAGSALAIGVCLWVPFILSIPAILLSPLLLFGFDRSRVRLVLETGFVIALIGTLVYGAMIIHLGIHDVAGMKAWIASSAHGILPAAPLRAVQRMIFSLARNLVNMGNDGRLFKRYIVSDAFNPVSLADLLRLSLWKLVLFYFFLAAVLINLVSFSLGRRTLALVAINALPVLLFAVFLFESGSIDRYLPIFPMLFLALAVSLGKARVPSWPRAMALVFVAVAVASNIRAMSTKVLTEEQERVATRIREVQPLLKPESRVVTVNQQDDLYAFNQNFPFNPINRSGELKADILVDPGTTQILRWRQIFAAKTLAMWDNSGDVWLTKRVFQQRPLSEWNWVEGDDPRVSWNDIYAFSSQIEMGQSAGGEDGFTLVLPSSRNRQLFSGLVQSSTSE